MNKSESNGAQMPSMNTGQKESFRFARFLLVGGTGLLINNFLLVIFTETLDLFYLWSAILATQGSTLWNYVFTEIWVFADRPREGSPLGRALRYFLMNNAALLLRGPLMAFLVSVVGLHYVAANLISIFALTIARYLLSYFWIWPGRKETSEEQSSAYLYDIHGIIRVKSEAQLPELDYFRVPALPERADLHVRIGRTLQTDDDTETIHYQDGLGRFGFDISIHKGAHTEVMASSLLGSSPHVLYTNVVEPILRWMFVREGYALIHGACISFDGRAAVITARTDTGKTTTVLRSLDSQSWAFLSDDMTILSRDGGVFSYPKPLTISRHTLDAVRQSNLTPFEQFTLQFQSRLHSRTGRRFALILSRLKIPAATLNTIVQLLVPPPKYMIQRLIPGISIDERSHLNHLVLIERGGELQQPMDHEELVETLMRNAADAYGFPPYPAIENFLRKWDGLDLVHKERSIIKESIRSCRGTRLRDPAYRWWERLPQLLKLMPHTESNVVSTAARSTLSIEDSKSL